MTIFVNRIFAHHETGTLNQAHQDLEDIRFLALEPGDRLEILHDGYPIGIEILLAKFDGIDDEKIDVDKIDRALEFGIFLLCGNDLCQLCDDPLDAIGP